LKKKFIFAPLNNIQTMANEFNFSKLKQQFKENKQVKTATMIVGGLLVVILGYIVYRVFVYGPKNEKASDSYYEGYNLAEKDSTDAAITSLESTIRKYDGAENIEPAKFKLASLYMKKGSFKKAYDLLDDTDLDDTYGPAMILGLKGDCQSEMGKYADALDLYEEAADVDDNEMTTPMYLFKAGLVAEELKQLDKAAELYERIRDNFSNFASQKAIEKYIARVTNKTE
jgi:tetratricopeptide (TPR) repeat protein